LGSVIASVGEVNCNQNTLFHTIDEEQKMKPLYAPLIFVVALTLAGQPGAVAADPAPGDETGLVNEVIQEFNIVYRSQQPDGSLLFPGPYGLFSEYPLLATLTLAVHRDGTSTAFVSRSVASASRYYSHLFTSRDRNANLLIESDLRNEDGTLLTGVENPGYNALLSLDMISLARLNLVLRKPLDALYWYEGARTMQSQLVDRCYDVDANYFFPFDTNRGAHVQHYYALSIAPLLFGGNVGDNHARSLISHYVLQRAEVVPEPPSIFLDAPSGDQDPLFRPGYLTKALVVAKTLHAAGYPNDAQRVRQRVEEELSRRNDDDRSSGRHPTATARYLAYMISAAKFTSAYNSQSAADIFAAIARYKRRLPDNEIVSLDQSIHTLKEFENALHEGNTEPPTHEVHKIETAIRNVYGAVSKTREQVIANTMYDRDDSYRTSGLDLRSATIRLLDDVVYAMRRAENNLYRLVSQKAGMSVAATVLDERAVVGQRIEVKWAINANGTEPIEIRSAEVIRGQEADALVAAGETVIVHPGQPHIFTTSFTARPDKVGSLTPWNLTLSLHDGHGRRIRYNAMRTVFVENQIDVTASFPDGQILRGMQLPVDIRFVKRTNAQVTLTGTWFSPSGLQLLEGRQFQTTMSPAQDTLTVSVNVLVPSPCRPGSFPFKLKFFANGSDLGLISSSFFKPYQWLFLGPFRASETAISTPYPPEKTVDLRRNYAGAGKRIAWRELPETANLNFGELSMWGSLHPSGVGYMYTVIESSIEKGQCPVYLASNSPAALFLNGERVLDYRPSPDRVPARAEIRILRGMNNFLVKVVGDRSTRVFFKLGDDDNLASDEFNNNLWELVGNYGEFQERSRRMEVGESEDVQKLVTLRYTDTNAHSVSVIGSFNGWSPEHSRMRRIPDGSWEITLSLRPGKYAYRFLVNNRQQVLDPGCPIEEPDGYGGKNSVIYVTSTDN
jgi:hypothetical protein